MSACAKLKRPARTGASSCSFACSASSIASGEGFPADRRRFEDLDVELASQNGRETERPIATCWARQPPADDLFDAFGQAERRGALAAPETS